MEVVRNLNLLGAILMTVALFAMIIELRWTPSVSRTRRSLCNKVFVICSTTAIGVYILSSVIALIQVFQPS